MSIQRRSGIVLLFIAIFILPRAVRAQDVTGTWTIDYPVRISNEGGVERVDSSAIVTLTLAQTGESVQATWQMEGATRARMLHGTVRDGLLTMSDTMDAMIRRNDGPPMDVRMVSLFELRLDGDRLVGTQSAESVDGSVRASPRAISAARAGTR
jgi:hypothetical protein